MAVKVKVTFANLLLEFLKHTNSHRFSCVICKKIILGVRHNHAKESKQFCHIIPPYHRRLLFAGM